MNPSLDPKLAERLRAGTFDARWQEALNRQARGRVDAARTAAEGARGARPAAPPPVYGATAPNPTLAKPPLALRAGETLGRVANVAGKVPVRALGGAGLLLYSPALGDGREAIDPNDPRARLPDRSRFPEGAGGFALPGFYRPPITQPTPTIGEATDAAGNRLPVPKVPGAPAPATPGTAGLVGGLPMTAGLQPEQDVPVGGVTRLDAGNGEIVGLVRGAEGGGALRARADQWAATPGTLSVLPNAAAMGSGGATFDPKTGQLTGGTEQDLAAARQLATQRGTPGWNDLERLGLVSPSARPEAQVHLIAETPDAVPSWRQGGGLPYGKPGDRAKRQSILAAQELADRRQAQGQTLGLQQAELAQKAELAKTAGALEGQKLAQEAQLAREKGVTDLLAARIQAGKPTDAARKHEELVGQGVPPETALGLAYGAFKPEETELGTRSYLNLLAPGGVAAGGAGTPVAVKSAEELAKLPPGTVYLAPDGSMRRKPERPTAAGPTGNPDAPAEEAQATGQQAAALQRQREQMWRALLGQ